MSKIKSTFEIAYPEINKLVQARRLAWTYTSISEWADISQNLTLRIFNKWHTFDPSKGPLENWVNRLITNALLNAKRDIGGQRFRRPCLGEKGGGPSCGHNTGGDTCSYTKSGTQCSQCPLYANWDRTRRHQFNIKSTVSLENHAQEVSNKPQESFDVEGVQTALHAKMRENLTQWEYRLYDALYIRHLKPAKVSEELQALVKTWKRAPREDEITSYTFVLTKQRWFRELMFEALKREGYDLEALIDYDR